jgi:uncharacterized linocin/CFP29 family protein
MDLLRKSLAPITDAAWEEINEQATLSLETFLTARNVVDVDGPKGWDYTSVPQGRLSIKNSDPKKVRYGIFQVLPLVETRRTFVLDSWELDNAVRGAEDIDLGALEDAAKEIAMFEEKAIYYGLDDANIPGLVNSSEFENMQVGEDPKQLVATLSEALMRFKRNAIEGPFHFVVSQKVWKMLAEYEKGYPVRKVVENMIGGKVILNTDNEHSFLISGRGGDFKLSLGQDYSIGYESHSNTEVELFFAASFTFQVLEPKALIVLE